MDVLVGLQYGDEGKGKITDRLSSNYDIVARYQGGNNAGHTIYHNGEKIVLHHIPSGIINPETKNFLGNGMVINPYELMKGIKEIEEKIPGATERIYVSKGAHLITALHLLEDFLDKGSSKGKIGTTMKGIGPCYRDKVYRKGLRVEDIFSDDFKSRVSEIEEKITDITVSSWDLGETKTSWKKKHTNFLKGVKFLKKNIQIVDNNQLRKLAAKGETVLAEGAQGTMLDIEHGSFPFVTSSSTISSGATTGLAMPPQSIDRVFGVFKAYLTRVGNGEMDTELFDETGEHLTKVGNEFGATTGRPRRCGWLNLDELKESVELNGVTDLIMTKGDVMCGMKNVKILWNNEYHTFDGWDSMTVAEIFPLQFIDKNLNDYIKFIERKLEMRISIVSTSPQRNDVTEFAV